MAEDIAGRKEGGVVKISTNPLPVDPGITKVIRLHRPVPRPEGIVETTQIIRQHTHKAKVR